MSLISRSTGIVLVLAFFHQAFGQQCRSSGVDFEHGGTYFQNVLSNDPFTALQEFEGCQNDFSNNILVFPNGDQVECSETNLQPDLTPMLVTCPDVLKSSLRSGDYSLIVISNNGYAGQPLAKQRDFELVVDRQEVITVTPTVTITDFSTPISYLTSTVYDVVTSFTPSTTTTGPARQTITPRPTTITTTRAFVTITRYTQVVKVSRTRTTVAASCVPTPRRRHPLDRDAVILPVVGPSWLRTIVEKRDVSASAKFRRALMERRSPSQELQEDFVRERGEALAKRAPDSRTVTTLATDRVATQTLTQMGEPVTQTVEVTVSSTAVVTSGVSVKDGKRKTTLPARTRTITNRAVIARVTKTRTVSKTITNTVKTTPPGAIQSCARKGGKLQ